MKYAITILLALATCLVSTFAVADPGSMLAQIETAATHSINYDSLGFVGLAGLVVNKEAIKAVFTSLKTKFTEKLRDTKTRWQATAMLVTSTTAENSYKWMSRFPKMRKWVGDKQFKALKAFTYSIVNDDWEATVEVDRNDIADNQLGGYPVLAEDAAYSSATLPDDIIDELKNNAFVDKCYDGKPFYATNHKVGKYTINNKGTVKLSNADRASADASIGAALIAVAGFVDSEGDKLKLVVDTLECSIAKSAIAESLANDENLADGTPNPYRGKFKVEVNPGLTNDEQWMVHVTNRPLKPFIYQERQAPEFVSQTDMNADDVFKRRMFKFGSEARAAGGYTLPQLSWGSDGSA